ncbi:hypothetical protein GGP41_005923 [Bipolaris sorokiniana]|uniref:FAD-binding domain-containing protein n=1 Tax=Cochliobolus sativus TaxID=45130 RepID=A0A8H5ZHX3_COCSA|nr:hypothetical protein GGP41_005923 [Bipolaris sorokiniana]
MGGLAAALALAKAGHKNITIYENAPVMGFVGAGIQLAPNMARILDRLGCWGPIRDEAVVCANTSIKEGSTDKELGFVDLGYVKEKYGYPHMVGHRASLANGLFEGCKKESGITFKLGCTLSDFRFGSKPKFTVTPSQGSLEPYQVECDILLGADGVKSSTRVAMLKELGHTGAARDSGQAAYRIMLNRSQMEHDPELLKLIDSDTVTRWIGEKKHIIAPETIERALRLYEKLRKPRAEALVELAAESGRQMHLGAGKAKEERDKAFAALKEGKGKVPDRWADADVQANVYGVDVVAQAEELCDKEGFGPKL